MKKLGKEMSSSAAEKEEGKGRLKYNKLCI